MEEPPKPDNGAGKEAQEETKTPAIALGPATERYRMKLAFILAVFGIAVAALLVLLLPLSPWGIKAASDVVAIVGLITSVLGTLVGLFFGVQIGSTGTEAANTRAADAQKLANVALGMTDKMSLDQLKDELPSMFA